MCHQRGENFAQGESGRAVRNRQTSASRRAAVGEHGGAVGQEVHRDAGGDGFRGG